MVRKRFWITSVLTLAGVHGCGGDGGREVGTGQTDFCLSALARVQEFSAFWDSEKPTGERYGGTVVAAGVGELVGGLNPFGAAEAVAAQHQLFVGLMTLIQFDEEMEAVPYLAESWETSEDGTEVTFRLRRDVLWHDGEKTTAFDVAFTYQRVSDPAAGFPNASLWSQYTPGPGGVEVVDSFTVRFRLDRPYPGYLIPWQSLPILPQHLLGDVPLEELSTHPFGTLCPVGNGPFRFLSHTPDDRWVFEANPSFPEELGGRPFPDRYEYRVIPENATLLAELLTGNIDLYIAVLPNQVDQIRAAPGVDVVTFPYRSVSFVAWNTRRPHLSDPMVRRALTLATPRARLLEGVRRGAGIVANSGVPPHYFGYSASLGDSLGFDPIGAGELLDQAGWVDGDGDGFRENADGTRLRILLKTNSDRERQEVAEVLQAAYRAVGIETELSVLDFGTLVGQITDPESRDFDGVILGWEVGFDVDETDLFHSRAEEGPLAFVGLQDDRIDSLLDSLRVVPDRDTAFRLWQEYQERILQLQPFTYLYFPHRQDGVSARLNGVELDLRGEWQGIRAWWISPEARR